MQTSRESAPASRRGPGWKLAAWSSLALLVGACFGGDFVQGLPCNDDYDCGPELHCVSGLCGGLGLVSVCGNWLLETGEECDDGNLNDDDGCSAACVLLAVCGDGIVGAGEECDDGNLDDTDACNSMCHASQCDDTILDGDETDVDCGGSCDACVIGDSCLVDDDCLGGVCGDSSCVEIVYDIDAGGMHTCALLNTGVRCWGLGINGQLGFGNINSIGDDETPASAGNVEVGGRVSQMAAGADHTCALLDDGTLRCWGRGAQGQLGYGDEDSIGDFEPPASVDVVDVGGPVTQVTAGAQHTCAVLDGGTLRCWGAGAQGQLGYGNIEDIGDDESPTADVPIVETVLQVAAGDFHTCAVLEAGTVRCWGLGEFGQLGYGNTDNIGDDEPPTGDVFVGGKVKQLTAGSNHTCALLDTGTVRCWGSNEFGQLGYGNTDTIGDDETLESLAEPDVEVGGTVTKLSAGGTHTCAILDGGNVRCWGNGEAGRLGYANTNAVGDDETPESLANPDIDVGGQVLQLTAGGGHTCAFLMTGKVRCWGEAQFAQLGFGDPALDDVGDNETPAEAGDVPCLR